ARPTDKHLHAVKRIFRYLKGTVNHGLWYPKDTAIALTAFADADHAGCQDTRRSTSGSMQMLGDRLVSWSSKRQKSAAISLSESSFGTLGTSDNATSERTSRLLPVSALALPFFFALAGDTVADLLSFGDVLGALPSNTEPNPRGDLKAITTRSSVFYDGLLIPPTSSLPREVEREPKVTKDKPSSAHNNNYFEELPKRNPHQPSIPYAQRQKINKQKEKSDTQLHKFLEMFKKLHFNISLAEALVLMPKYTKMMKDLLSNKEKLLEVANTPLNENCSAVILKKLPEKLGDPGHFLIQCDFTKMAQCMALADLGASINLMPLAIYQKLKFPGLVSTRMTLEQ
ncbi:reverse transcriptase domain-containing protein, partial [Tanacetum coccineum]